jgi:hypothetical protein
MLLTILHLIKSFFMDDYKEPLTSNEEYLLDAYAENWRIKAENRKKNGFAATGGTVTFDKSKKNHALRPRLLKDSVNNSEIERG